MKKTVAILLAVLLLIAAVPFTVTAEGTGDLPANGETVRPLPPIPEDGDPLYEGGFQYEILEGMAVITGYTGNASKVTIPATLSDCPVVEIAEDVFANHVELTEVSIPDTVIGISYFTFEGCTILLYAHYEYGWYLGNENNPFHALMDVDQSDSTFKVAEGTRVIADYACCNYTALTGVYIPSSVVSIGEGAFCGCSKLFTLSIPTGTVLIGPYAFESCIALQQIKLSDTVTYLGPYAFSGCAVSGVDIPAGVIVFDPTTFCNCPRLINVYVANDNPVYYNYEGDGNCIALKTTKTLYAGFGKYVSIPDGVTAIGELAFYSSTLLTNITIPASVKEIGNSAFAGCSSLTKVTYKGSEKDWSLIRIGDDNDPLLNANYKFTECYVHDWGETTYTWNAALTACVAEHICQKDTSHVERELVETVRRDEGDQAIFTATFTTEGFEPQTKTVLSSEIPTFSYVWGDTNGDGKITSADIIRLKNYLAFYDYEEGTSPYVLGEGADANGDGKVTSADIIRLKNYLAFFDYETGISTYILGPAAK